MTTKQRLITTINTEIEDRQNMLAIVNQIKNLDNIDFECQYLGGLNHIDFDRLTHEQVIQTIKAIGGKWKKTLNDDASINYVTTIDKLTIRLWHGEPPPNCKIIEILEEIPAQPARMEMKKMLVCQ